MSFDTYLATFIDLKTGHERHWEGKAVSETAAISLIQDYFRSETRGEISVAQEKEGFIDSIPAGDWIICFAKEKDLSLRAVQRLRLALHKERLQ